MRFEAESPRAAALWVALAASLPYVTALQGSFVSDAATLLGKNPELAASSGWIEWFGRDFYWGTPIQDVTLYRPLTLLSLLAQVRTTGLAPLPFLAVNVALHVVVSLAVLVLGRSLLTPRAALAGALLFAVHPIHTEAVAWIMGRSELLAAALALASCLCFLRAADRAGSRRVAWAAAAAAAFFAAVLSKEHVATLPVWMAAATLLIRRRRPPASAWLAVALAGAALAGFAVLRSAALRRVAEVPLDLELFNPAADLPTPWRWLAAAGVTARYAALLAWPGTLSHDYSLAQIPTRVLGGWEVAGILVVVLAAAAIVLAARREPGLAIVALLGPITGFAVSNVPIVIGTIMAERLVYLPSVSAALAAGWLLGRLPRRRAFAALGLFVLAALTARTAVRNLDWRDDRTLYEAALVASPRSAYVKAVVADQALARGDIARAETLVRSALEIHPDYYDGRVILARTLIARSAWLPAAAEIRAAYALATDDPARSRLRGNLGYVLYRAGRIEESIREYREALRLDPSNQTARSALTGDSLPPQR
jgi:tetratricopeptide (TPR) repeat protein